MSGKLEPGRLQDPALRPIAEKVLEGRRLDAGDAAALYQTADLLGLGAMADHANRRRNGDRVFFSANQHINPTNVCILRNTCTFCSFARMPKEDGAYTMTLEEAFAEADRVRDRPAAVPPGLPAGRAARRRCRRLAVLCPAPVRRNALVGWRGLEVSAGGPPWCLPL